MQSMVVKGSNDSSSSNNLLKIEDKTRAQLTSIYA